MNGFSNCIRDLNIIIDEEKSDNKPKRIAKTLQYIIGIFYDRFTLNSAPSTGNSMIFLGKEESQKNIDIFKYNAQLLLELQLLSHVLKKYYNEQLKEKANIACSIILGYLGIIDESGDSYVYSPKLFEKIE